MTRSDRPATVLIVALLVVAVVAAVVLFIRPAPQRICLHQRRALVHHAARVEMIPVVGVHTTTTVPIYHPAYDRVEVVCTEWK